MQNELPRTMSRFALFGGTPWWKDPRNRQWYRFITRWCYSGWLLLLVIAVAFYAANELSSGDEKSKISIYKRWLLWSILFCITWSLAFFPVGLRVYFRTKASVAFTRFQMLTVFATCVFMWWFTVLFCLFRNEYGLHTGRIIFEFTLMMGLVLFALSLAHVLIALAIRYWQRTRGESDVG